jgi:hypothetical protein
MDIGRFMSRAFSFSKEHRGAGQGLAALLTGLLAIGSAEAAVDRAGPKAPGDVPLATASIEEMNGAVRITLDLIEAVGHVAKREGDELIIWFDQPRRFDLSSLADRDSTPLKGARVPAAGSSRWLVIDLEPGSGVRSERLDGHRLVITLDGGPGEATTAAPPAKPKAAKNNVRAALRDMLSGGPVRPAPKPGAAAKVEGTKGDIPVNGKVARAKPLVEPKNGARAGPRPLMPMARPAGVTMTSASPAIAAQAPKRASEAVRRSAEAETEAKPPAKQNALPGQFEVDEIALDRALERTLTREGAVLMPFGMVELEPSLSYTRRELDTPALINIFGFPGFGEANITRNDYTASLALRVGLPFDAQLEVDAPFTYVDQSETTAIGFDPVNTMDDDAGAFGDLGVGLAKTLIKEGMWRPDVVARVRWDSQTGKSVENDIAFGGGNHELTGSLSLVKSQDPLAFFGSVAYEKTFEEDDLDPGDRIGISIGTVLAASPETSLRASLRQDFIGDAEFEGDTIEGTDQVAASLSIGASSVLGKGVLVDASVDIGLTDDAPDYAARISFPVRFDARPMLSSLGAGRSSSEEGSENGEEGAGNDG